MTCYVALQTPVLKPYTVEGSWEPLDLTAEVPAGAVAAKILLFNTSAGGGARYRVGFKHPDNTTDNTDELHEEIWADGWTEAIAPIKETTGPEKRETVYYSANDNVEFRVVGYYLAPDSVIFVVPPELIGSVPDGVSTDLSISPHTGADQALCGLFYAKSRPHDGLAWSKGGVDQVFPKRNITSLWFPCPLDPSEQARFLRDTNVSSLRLFGYIKNRYTQVNGDGFQDVTPTITDETFQPMTPSPTVAGQGAAFVRHNHDAQTQRSGVRETGDTTTFRNQTKRVGGGTGQAARTVPVDNVNGEAEVATNNGAARIGLTGFAAELVAGPTVSNLQSSNITPASVDIACDTDTDGGDMWAMVVADGVVVTDPADIEAGVGAQGDGSISAAVSGTPVITVDVGTVGSLAASTDYEIVAAHKAADGTWSNIVTIPLRTADGDVTAPVWTDYPYVDLTTLTETAFDIKGTQDENGVVYGVRVPSGDPKPTSAQVKAGQNAAGQPADAASFALATGGAEWTLSGLDTGAARGVAYDVYIASEDTEPVPNLQAEPTLLAFNTRNPLRIAFAAGDALHDENDLPIASMDARIQVFDGWSSGTLESGPAMTSQRQTITAGVTSLDWEAGDRHAVGDKFTAVVWDRSQMGQAEQPRGIYHVQAVAGAIGNVRPIRLYRNILPVRFDDPRWDVGPSGGIPAVVNADGTLTAEIGPGGSPQNSEIGIDGDSVTLGVGVYLIGVDVYQDRRGPEAAAAVAGFIASFERQAGATDAIQYLAQSTAPTFDGPTNAGGVEMSDVLQDHRFRQRVRDRRYSVLMQVTAEVTGRFRFGLGTVTAESAGYDGKATMANPFCVKLADAVPVDFDAGFWGMPPGEVQKDRYGAAIYPNLGWVGDDITEGSGEGAGSFGYLIGNMVGQGFNRHWPYRGAVPAGNSTDIRTQFVADTTVHTDDWVHVFWVGHNDVGTAFLSVEANLQTMVDALPHDRFVVLGMIPNSTWTAGQVADMEAVNNAWAAQYGNRYIDMRRELQRKAGTAGLYSPPDYLLDDIHLNVTGSEKAAEIVANRLAELGWMDGVR